MATDILILGATGFTGRLVTSYLAQHQEFQSGSVSFAIAGRSKSKLDALKAELGLPERVEVFSGVNVSSEAQLEEVVQRVRVVINAVGPYWTWGTPVVRACARHGVHYVDLTGETPWLKKIIIEQHYLATKTGAIIIPSCGMDSIPPDVLAYLGAKTLYSHFSACNLEYPGIDTSITAWRIRGGFSGGTLASLVSVFEDVPPYIFSMSMQNEFSLSPLVGEPSGNRLFFSLEIPDVKKTLSGGLWLMRFVNRALVQRTWGVIYSNATGAIDTLSSPKAQNAFHYGPRFKYDEFLVIPSKIATIFWNVGFISFFFLLYKFSWFRWLIKKVLPESGSGPSEEELRNSWVNLVNITTSDSSPPVKVKTTFRSNIDPGYLLSSQMITESALTLVSGKVQLGGGIWTPMSALGDELVSRLKRLEALEIEGVVVQEGAASSESRKNI